MPSAWFLLNWSARAKHDFSKLSVIFSDLEHDTEHSSSEFVTAVAWVNISRTIHPSSRQLLHGDSQLHALTADVCSIIFNYNNSSNTSVSIKPDLPTACCEESKCLVVERTDGALLTRVLTVNVLGYVASTCL